MTTLPWYEYRETVSPSSAEKVRLGARSPTRFPIDIDANGVPLGISTSTSMVESAGSITMDGFFRTMVTLETGSP